ncbi:MAG: MCE family protein, partial [Armatimonadetes bacterium]|nr:MCE family protein [Armatimonadota bacterium]
MSAEVKVGAIFLVVVIAVTGVALYLGGLWARVGTYVIMVRFADAGTVEPGADVMLAGVRVGTVASVELAADEVNWPGRPVRMKLAIKREVKIPRGYEFGIAQGGLLGTRYIAVVPPEARPAEKPKITAYLSPGEEVAGKGPVGLAALDTLAESARKALPGLEEQVATKIDKLSQRLE